MSDWYVIYTKEQREAVFADALKRNFLCENEEAITIKREYYHSPSRQQKKEAVEQGMDVYSLGYQWVALLPGYVFIETEAEREEIYKRLSDAKGSLRINMLDQSILPPKYENAAIYDFRLVKSEDIKWREFHPIEKEEKDFLKSLCDENYMIGRTRGYKKDGTIHYTEGPLVGKEEYVTFVDRHRRFGRMNIRLFGKKHTVNVAVDVKNA